MRINTDHQMTTETAPRVYQANDSHFFLSWIIEGTDGSLYRVPSEPGGWKHRSPFTGSKETLTLVSAQKARAIAHFVAGHSSEPGQVVIAQDIELQTPDFAQADAGLSRTAW